MVKCKDCGGRINDAPDNRADNYHMACCLEACYKSRGQDPGEGKQGKQYHAACVKRKQQIEGG